MTPISAFSTFQLDWHNSGSVLSTAQKTRKNHNQDNFKAHNRKEVQLDHAQKIALAPNNLLDVAPSPSNSSPLALDLTSSPQVNRSGFNGMLICTQLPVGRAPPPTHPAATHGGGDS